MINCDKARRAGLAWKFGTKCWEGDGTVRVTTCAALRCVVPYFPHLKVAFIYIYRTQSRYFHQHCTMYACCNLCSNITQRAPF
jgi:hypothetical protein